MSLEFYKVLHLCGIFMIFAGLLGFWGNSIAGGPTRKNLRVALSVIHGIGMLFAFIGGFGLAGKMGLFAHLPLWIYMKLLIWLLFGASLGIAKRKAQWGVKLIALWVGLGTLAAYLAVYKPF